MNSGTASRVRERRLMAQEGEAPVSKRRQRRTDSLESASLPTPLVRLPPLG